MWLRDGRWQAAVREKQNSQCVTAGICRQNSCPQTVSHCTSVGAEGCSMPVVVIVTVTVVLVVALIAIPVVVIVMSAVAVTIIVNGMVVPIRVIPFPAMKALKPPWFTNNPDLARSQIVILTADNADVFVTVPDVIIRIHSHRHHGRGRFHGHAT